MQLLARSRIVIYTQGIERCISSKFSLAMAIGAVMVGEPLENNPAMREQNPHLDLQFGYTEPDAIAGRAIELAQSQEQVDALSANNMQMFDTQLRPRIAARDMLAVLFG